MCGIFGIVGPFSKPNILENLGIMQKCLVHRGPDDRDIWADNGFGFGICRLAIIDELGGKQPMWNKHNNIGMVYNGEIYNYNTLKLDLIKRGHDFSSNSDSEVALRSYLEYGPSAVQKWIGMFATAYCHIIDKKLILIRDRLGKKPLYYYKYNDTLVFASEIKAILKLSFVKTGINKQALWDYFTYRYVPGPQTIWDNIYKIEPGHYLEHRFSGQTNAFKYWDNIDFEKNQSDINFDNLETALVDAIKIRLDASDFPVGILLSGGLDSSIISMLAEEIGYSGLHSFSIGFDESGDKCELPYAHEVAKKANTIHHEIKITKEEFIDDLNVSMYHMDEPLANFPLVALYKIFKTAKNYVKVMLGGEGADEILGGYTFHYDYNTFQKIQKLQKLPQFLLRLAYLSAYCRKMDKKKQFLSKVCRINLSEWNLHELPNETKIFTQNEKKLLWKNFEGDDSLRILKKRYSEAKTSDPILQMLLVWQKDWLVENLLMSLDKMSMANSIELRTPFLDHRLVDWANNKPTSFKISLNSKYDFGTKFMLREISQNRLPKTIINRPKQGFFVPTSAWLKDDKFSKFIRWHLCESADNISFLEKAEVIKLLSRATNGDIEAEQRVWLVLFLKIWLDVYNVSL